jgi:hypothetical protein
MAASGRGCLLGKTTLIRIHRVDLPDKKARLSLLVVGDYSRFGRGQPGQKPSANLIIAPSFLPSFGRFFPTISAQCVGRERNLPRERDDSF